MGSIVKTVLQLFIVVVVIAAIGIIYLQYQDQIKYFLLNREESTVYIGDLAILVTIADEPAERAKGLSGTNSLSELEGKLFVFDENGRYGIWMKDMNYPIDIIWISDELEIIHIEENVLPNTFPRIYRPDVPARYVLEVNAYFTKTFKVEEGQRVILPAEALPSDVRANLQ